MPLDLVTRPEVLDGEILAPGEGGISVLGAAHPFRTEQTALEVPPGLTVQEILDLALMQAGVAPGLAGNVHVMLERDGRQWEVDRQYFRQVRPKPGTNLLFRVAPKGGGGGGKNPLRTMLMLAVTVAAMVVAPYIAGPAVMGFASGSTGFAIASGVIGAGITIVGGLLVNAIAPPRLPELSTSSNAAESPTYRLAGARNVANHFGPVPSILGRHRVHPNYGAMPYTEMVGQDNYLRMLFVFGYGPLALEDIRIGETPITDYTDWEMELRGVEWVGSGAAPGTLLDDDDPFTLYPSQVVEAQVGVVLEQNVPITRTSEPDVDELSVDLDFPQGLVRFSSNDGGRRDRSVEVEVEYRPVGGGAWEQVLAKTYTERSAKPLRFGHRWQVPRGQYEIRVRRITENSSSDRIFDTLQWAVLRSIRDEDPIEFEKPLAALAIRIKANEQLSGVIDSLNAICTTIALDYRNGSWGARPTTNPASLYRHVLQGPANARPRTNDQIDLPALEAWHQFCEVEGFAFNHVRDFDASVWSTLADIASAGRAAPAILDGRWGVVMDGAGKPVVQHITPRNSWGFSAERVYRHLPHGWRIRFINEESGWNHDERIVYDDGYDEDNATLFEGLEIPGVTDPDLIWRHGRYHIASARLRPEVFSWNMDFEHIVFRRGDLVRVTHDVTMWGLGSARVKEVLRDGSLTTGIVLDDELPAEAGKEYAVRVRRQDGASWVRSVTNPGGTSYALDFKTPVAQAQGPQVGDLVLFGEEGQESVELLIRSIEPGGDLTARVTGIDYAPQLYLADTGPIPPYDPQITRPPDLTEQAPEVPRIIGIVTGSAALQNGREEGRIIVRVAPFSGTIPVRWIETRHRLRGSEDSWTITREDAEGQTVVIRGVEVSDDTEEVHYDIAARSVSPWGVRSAWSDEVGTESAADDIPPGPVTGLRTQGGLRQIVVSWENPPDPDLDHVEVWAATSNDRALATRVGLVKGSSFVHGGLGGLDTRWYWARAVDVGGNIGPWNAEQGTSGTTEQVSHDDMAKWFVDRSILLPDIMTRIDKIPLIEETLSGLERFGGRHRERTTKGFADVREEITVVYDDLQATAERVTVVEAMFGDPENPDPDTAWARIYENQQAIAAEGTARAQAITAIEASIGDPNDPETGTIYAAIKGLDEAIVDESQARATAISEIEAIFGDPGDPDAGTVWARIYENEQAIADEASARATAVQQIHAEIGDNLALIQNNQQAIADESSARATAVSQLQASIGDNAALIQDNQQAIADESSARATAISTLQAEVNGNFAAIQTNASAIADVDGLLQAQYTLKVQAGDVIAGFGLAADSGLGSEMVFLADRFAFVQPGQDNTPRYPFVIGTVNGQSRISLASTFIQDLSLPGIKLADGAITARKLAISPSENVAVEPYFEEGGANWTHSSEVTFEPHAGPRSPGGHRARIGASTSNQSLYSSRIRVEPGETYLFRAVVARVGTATTGNLRLTVRNLLADGTMHNYGTTNSGMTDPSEGGFKTLEATVTIDEDIYFVQPSLQVINSDGTGSGWHVYSIFFARRVGTTLIDDNGITTPKVRADTIITDHLIGAAVNDTYSTTISSETYLSTNDNDKRTGVHTIGSYTTTSEGQGRIYFWLSNGYAADSVVAYAQKNSTLTASANIWLRAKYGSSTVNLSSDADSSTGSGAVTARAEIHGTYGYLSPGANTTVTFELESETDGGSGQHTHHQNAVRLMILECKR